jgi:hypothetical protein
MTMTTEKAATVSVWRDTMTYPPRIVATATNEDELVALRYDWYAERRPQGYGEALIVQTSDGRYRMSQSLSSD